jgi:glc operon protein GlcG
MATISLTLDLAKKITLAAEQEAAKNGWAVTVVILDEGGLPVCLHRMDGAAISSMEIARQKAWSAIGFKRPTKVFEEQLANGRIGVLRLAGVIPVEGGIPLALPDGSVVGAIGVSGVTSVQDGQVATAGVQALLNG